MFAHCEEFVNADLIARGLSPFAAESVAIKAGKLVIERIHELVTHRQSFGIETTLSGKGYFPLFKKIKSLGYKLHLFFLWVPQEELAVQRVADRVRMGGHFIPEKDIRRRYKRGIANFWNLYKALIDEWIIFDNSGERLCKVAHGNPRQTQVLEAQRFRLFSGDYNV